MAKKKPILTKAQVGLKKPLIKLSPDELKMERLKQYAQQQSRKEQPSVQPRGSTPDDVRKQMYEDAQRSELKNQFLRTADVATDLMQFGNFVPNPIGQAIGTAGNILGGWVDAYQTYDAYNKGEYGDAAINAASVALPMGLGANTFRRNSKYLRPGQPLYPLSPQANVPAISINIPRADYIEPFTKVKGMTNKNLLANRLLLGTLGAETIYDSYENGGWLDKYSDVPKAQIGTALKPITAENVSNFLNLLSIPQKALTKLISGKYQTPSEAMGIKNKAGAIATDIILDPVNLIGAGAVKASGAYKNAYKLNPWAFKPNPEAKYRMLGSKGYADALESGVIRPPKTQDPFTQFENAYYSAGFPRDIRYRNLTGNAGYEGPYMTEVTGNSEYFAPLEPLWPGDPLDITYSTKNIPIDKQGVKFYKENWLKGYKEVKPPKKKQDGGGIEGTMGGLTDVGFNYNGAWGGPSMQNGGLTFLEPTSRKLPKGYVIPYNTPSTELAMSIGGEDGEPAYLIPSFKYGRPLQDPISEFRKTGEHLGGPFKTWQEADEWERTVRHPYVEKGQSIPTPFKRWGKDFAMGGSLPGAVGSTYARTGGIPSEGPRGKKTIPSAQDGKEIEYKEIPEITLTGLGEIIYKHSPSSQGYYELSKTATPFTSKRQIKENINAPKSPKDVNFISNYRGALGGIDKYPTSVPFEGEKHWNIDRFIIDPAFGNSYPALESGQSKKQLKLNVLSDMYKYNMLQGQNKDDAFRNAKKFMRQEINPRINNSFFKNVILGNADPYTSSITNFANENPISIKRSRDEFVKENPNNIFFKRYAENPWSETKNRNVIMDYLKDYKKMSSKDARKQYRDWKKEADEEAIRKKEEFKNRKPLTASFSVTEEYKDGGEMQYYQQGLDWKPKNISKNGDMIPKAQPGKILPKWQQRLQEEAAKLDSPLSTLNLSKKGYTKDEIKTIQSSAKKEQPVIQSAKTVTNPILEEQQRRRMARVAADKYGMKFNEETGNVEKALDLSPQTLKTLRKASENIVEPMIEIEGAMGAGSLIKTGLKKGYSSLLRYPIFKDIDRKFVYPIQFRNEIAELKKLHAAAPERFSTGEAAERLKNVLGINPKDIDQPLLTFTPEGSYYYSLGNVINIDLRQAKQLAKESGLTPKGVYGHEYGHFLQREAHRHSEEFAKELMDYQEQLARYNSPENLEMLNDPDVWLLGKNRDKVVFNPGMAPLPRPHSTLIDKYANEVYNVTPTGIDMEPMSRYAFENSDYFTYRDLEQMPHLREMRQGMLDKGYIKDLYEPISEGTIQRFIAENPTDRISSFTNPNNQERIKGLQKIFRNLPAVVPAIGAAATLDKKKKGGKVKKDDMGYWNPENWGEPVEIDSNEITMQGVYEPLIGISDTGDVQYMEPGEDYTFDGSSVTEYPIAQNGRTLPTIYTDNPNDPRLRKYQDSLQLSSRPQKNPNPVMSVKEWKKFHSAALFDEYKEKGILPIGFRDFSSKPYRATEPVYAKPKQKVEYRKPEPKQEVVKKQEPIPTPIKKEQPKPIEKPEVKKEQPKLPYRVDYSGGAKYFPSSAEGEAFMKQLNKDFMENKISSPGNVSGYYETKKKNGGWLDKYK